MSTVASNLVLAVESLTVTYPDGTKALDGIDLTLERGKCLAVVGESGCGKSTFLGALLGLLPRRTHINGSVLIGNTQLVGASARALRDARRGQLGYVPQDPYAAVDPLRSVIHHIRFAARAAGRQIGANEIEHRLGLLGISPSIVASRKWPHQWSGGMLQRACIAAATIADPSLVLADEPTSALDPDTGSAVLRDLRARAESLVIVTHDLAAAAFIADDVAVFYQGQVVEHGPVEHVLTHPEHPYTSSLLEAATHTRGTGS